MRLTVVDQAYQPPAPQAYYAPPQGGELPPRLLRDRATLAARSSRPFQQFTRVMSSSQMKEAAMSSSQMKEAALLVGERHTDEKNDSEMRARSRQRLFPYTPPGWAKKLKEIPSVRIELANKNTPIQRWYLPGVPNGFEVYIKRDDLTGCSLAGNKVRKLEFLMAEALDKGHDSLISCGGMNSNCCRALATAGRELGFTSHLLLATKSKKLEDMQMEGNSAMNQLLGASLYLMPKDVSFKVEVPPKMEKLATYLREHSKLSPYIVPFGGSNNVGLFGHLECFDEMKRQGALEEYTDLVVTMASVSTVGGFCIGNFLNGRKWKLHGMAACEDAAYFHDEVNIFLRSLGLQNGGDHSVTSEELLNIVEEVKGVGYGISTDEELDFIMETAASTGIFLDPTYTGKAVFHLVKRLQTAPESFKGKKILFYNTGSVLGMFDGRLKAPLQSTKTFHSIHDFDAMEKLSLGPSKL